MKRISTLGLSVVLGLVACGDDSGVAGADAGVFDGGLHSGLDRLGKQLGSDLDGVNGNLDDLDNRLKDLENVPPPPPPDSCSMGEDCIPDGLILSKAGLTTLVTAFCKNIFGCCDENEVFLNFGPDVTDEKACVARFESFVSRGLPPDFFVTPVVRNIALIAQALNSPGRAGTGSVELIDAGVKACGTQLEDATCAAAGVAAFCTPPGKVPTNECAPNKIVKGLLAEGEPCNLALAGAALPQCAGDLACANDGSGVDGICAKQASEGDACAVNADCATVDATLYCNQGTQTCAAFAKKGETCSYVDETLLFSGNEKDRCLPGLNCDPDSKKCVSACSTGTLCVANAACPEDTVCDQTTITTPGGSGFCRDAFAKGDDCTNDGECATGNCLVGVCAGDVGDACAAPGGDGTCISNYCGPNKKCTQDCFFDDDSLCPSTHYCDSTVGSECVPRITNGNGCDTDRDCVSGSWCNGASQCAAKVADVGACASGLNRECVNGYCLATVCQAPMPLMTTDCGGIDAACGPDAHCALVSGATPEDHCRAFSSEGETCDDSDLCEADLECDGHATTPKCYPAGEHPAGAGCVGGFQCLSGLCVGGECADPAGENDDCDTTLAMHPTCDAGLYCKTADAMTFVGTCKPQRTAGQSCLPRYMSADCLGGVAFSCTETYGGFYCTAAAVPAMTLVCDGT